MHVLYELFMWMPLFSYYFYVTTKVTIHRPQGGSLKALAPRLFP